MLILRQTLLNKAHNYHNVAVAIFDNSHMEDLNTALIS